MKLFLPAIAIGLALSSTLVQATTNDARSAQPAAKSQVESTAKFDRNLAQLQQLMRQMQTQMDRIRDTQDPQERQRLLQQHWDTMQSAMDTMRGMWGRGAMGPGMMGRGMMGPGMMGGAGPGWGHMGRYYSNLTPEQLRQRQYMTDQYLQMQQEMMNNMMWQQQYRGTAPAAGAKVP